MSSIPGNDYFDFNANGWRPGAQENWARNHQINQETGELEGDYPLPPHEVARGYQAMHDRAVWNYRRRLMDQGRARFQDATNYQRGALGLLQSFRSGGSAALEAGIYNQVAGGLRAQGGMDFQQAQMTQPLDLLSDLRRHEGVVAQRKADRASERQMIAQIISSNSQAARNSAANMNSGGGGSGANGGFGGGGGAGGGGGGSGMELDFGDGEVFSAGLEDPALGGGGQQQPGQGQGQGQQGSPFVGTGGGTGLADPEGGGVATQVEPFQQQGGGIGAGPGQGAPGDQQPGAGGIPPTGAAVAGAPGADGNFSSDAFAAASAASSIGSPLGDVSRIGLNHFLVDMYESDPFYQSLPFAIQAEWRKRLEGAA